LNLIQKREDVRLGLSGELPQCILDFVVVGLGNRHMRGLNQGHAVQDVLDSEKRIDGTVSLLDTCSSDLPILVTTLTKQPLHSTKSNEPG